MAVADPLLTIKLACLSETWASPMAWPFSPSSWSMIRPAESFAGFLKTQPREFMD